MLCKVTADAVVQFRADQRVVKQRSTHTDSRSAGNQKFDGILRVVYTALSDDGDVVSFANLVDLVNFQ